MFHWVVRRLAGALLLVLLVVSAVFFVVRLAPGDPLDQVAGEEMSADDRALLRSSLGLDGSLAVQYAEWISRLARGDLGTSLRQHRPVLDILAEAVPPTLLVTLTSYLLHLVLAVATATVLVIKRDHLLARAWRGGGLILYSLPAFWLGLMLIMLFSRKLGWFPAGGMHAPDAAHLNDGAQALDLLRHLALPVATLTLGSFMGTARYLQAGLAQVMNEDHILAARARGLPERTVIVRHGLRNALLPVITLAGLSLPYLLGGAVAVEVVFGWPGMGRVTLEAIWARDYPVIMATTIVAAIMVIAGSFGADLVYRWADPRVRQADERAAA